MATTEMKQGAPLQTPDTTPSHALAVVDHLTTTGWEQLRGQREQFRNALLHLGGYTSLTQAMDDIGGRTVIPIIAGGVATRWEKSFDTDGAQAVLDDPSYTVTRGRPRGLTLVPNVLPHDIWPHSKIPVFGYTLWQTRAISGAKRVVIHPEDAEEQDLEEMKFTAETLGLSIDLRPQRRREPHPKPLGHGDALVQIMDDLEGSDFVLPQFVSDASSPATIQDTLLALAVTSRVGLPVNVVVPTVTMDQPKYSVFIDENGLIRDMGHAKLLGEASNKGSNTTLSIAGSQIGIYPVATPALLEELEATYEGYRREGSYLFIARNRENGVNEYAIDNAILHFAQRGTVRQLAFANYSEIASSAKTVDALPKYVEMITEAIVDSGLTPSSR